MVHLLGCCVLVSSLLSLFCRLKRRPLRSLNFCLEAPGRLELRIAAVTWLNICTSTHTQSDNCGKEFTEQRGQYLLLNAI